MSLLWQQSGWLGFCLTGSDMCYKMYTNDTPYMLILKCLNKINIFCLLAQLMQLQKSHSDHTVLLDNVNTMSCVPCLCNYKDCYRRKGKPVKPLKWRRVLSKRWGLIKRGIELQEQFSHVSLVHLFVQKCFNARRIVVTQKPTEIRKEEVESMFLICSSW